MTFVELKPGEHAWLWCCNECGDMYCETCFVTRHWDDRDKGRCEDNDIEGPMPEGGSDV